MGDIATPNEPFPRCPMATIESDPKVEAKPKVARPKFGPHSAGSRMTVEEFDVLPASRFLKGYRYEVINGVLVVTPPVSIAESDPNDELGHLLRTYRETHPEGKRLDRTAPERYVPGTPNRRRCDRAIWVGLGRIPDVDRDVPAIAIEFVSSKKRDALRDYEAKRDEYLAAGVQEYWIIDRFRRIMTVYRKGLAGPTYEVVTETQSYRTDLLPGFALPLSALLAKADDWTRARRDRRNSKNKPTPPTGGTDG
jgi:Uma2 family endonuclease